MWINSKAYRAWAQQVQDFKQHVTKLFEAVNTMSSQLAEKDRQIQLLSTHVQSLLSIRNDMVKEHAASVTSAAIWRTRINELTIERAALLGRLIPGLELKVPIIQYTPSVEPPGASFDDMGDAASMHMGDADLLPMEEPMQGDPISVFDHNLDIGAAPGDTSAP